MRTLWLHLKSRRWLLRLLLLGVSTVVSLLLLEMAVRVLLPYYHPRAQLVFETRPSGVRTGPPGATRRLFNSKSDFDVAVTFNQLGLVDRKDLRTAKTNALYAIGDSYTMGWGLPEDERFSNLLEHRLGEPVYNVAIPTDLRGYQQLAAYAEEHGPRISRLVLAICMENDLHDYRADQPPRAPRKPPSLLVRTERWVRTHSALFLATTHNLQKIMFIRRSLERLGLVADGEQPLRLRTFDEPALRSCRDQVLPLAQGRELVVLLIPERSLWLRGEGDTGRTLHDRFAALLREAGLKVVDPLPRFDREGNPLQFYFKADPHWNARGHQIAAEELLAAMKPAGTNAP